MKLPLKQYATFFVRYLWPVRGRALLLMALILATIGLQLVNPQIIRYFIDTALAAGSGGAQTQNLVEAALTFLVAALLLQGLSVAAIYVGEDVGWRTTNQLRADLAHHCLRLDMSFHNSHTPGEMIERLDGDVSEIAIFFAQFVVRVLGNLLLLLGILLVLLREDWRISLAMTIYTVVALITWVYLRQLAVPGWEAARQATAELFGGLEEQLSGTEDLRSSGAVPYALRSLFKLSKVRLDAEVKAANAYIYFDWLWMFFATVGYLIAFIAGYLLFGEGVLTVGTVYLLYYYTERVLMPLDEISRQMQNWQKASAGVNRVYGLWAIENKIGDTGQQTLPAGAPLDVHFDGVTFGYAAETPVIRNLSFALAPGRTLGLLGRTGSGKTTLTRLLYRLYDPVSGSIALGASPTVDIRAVQLDSLRSRIGMVTQDVQLFHASVRDNLTFFNPAITDAQIMGVIETLELTEWYNRLPNGLDTALGSEGSSLSAGEAQLLAFTRVFLQDPGLVILDEASSRLDPATERLIERAVDKLLQNRTGIIVAHRLSTVQRADEILILQDGAIQEHGPRQQLAADPDSRFYALLKTGLEEVLVA